MSYSIGTPPFKVYGSLDTGSDFVWLQCKPCNICYNQTSPIFNPSKSSSYKKISCSSRTCKSMNNISCSHDDDSCEYTYGYGDGSYSQGDLSVETLTLDFTSGSSVSFPNFIIGCGHTNNLSYSSGHSFGIIGFGDGPLSLINQISSLIGGKFSYCLIGEFDKRSNLSSKLNFGDAAIVSGDNVVSTPIVGHEGVECFAFRPSRYGSAIFGNLSQKNLLVGFDLKNNVVSFKPTDCTKY
ncbi:hypothetical protein P8452_58568 [Trifolium repens]|nr:hypothetical protein P8452_58568 [Trifolium repens]